MCAYQTDHTELYRKNDPKCYGNQKLRRVDLIPTMKVLVSTIWSFLWSHMFPKYQNFYDHYFQQNPTFKGTRERNFRDSTIQVW